MTPEQILQAKYASAMQMLISQVDTIFTLRAQLEDALKQIAELKANEANTNDNNPVD